MFFSAHERNSCSISYSPWGMKSLFMIPLVCFKDTRERSASNIDNGRIPKLKPSPEIRKQNSCGPTFRKLIQLLRPHWFSLSLSTVSLLGYTSVTLSIPRLFGALLDHGGGNCAVASDSQWKRNLSGSGVRPIPMLLGCIVLGGLLNTLRLSLLGRVAEDIANQLRTGGFSCLMHKTASFYDNPDNASSVLSERLINDSARIGSALSESLANGAKNCCQILGSFSIMLHLSPVLTLSILCTLPPMAYTTAMYGRLVKRFSSLQQQTRARLIAYATERLSSIQVVLSLNKESYECRSFQKLAVEYVRLGRSSAIGNASNTGVVQTVGYIVLLGVLTLGKAEVNRGKLTSGKLFSFILYTVYCGLGILGVSNAVLELYKVLGIAQGNEYLNQAPKAANDSSTTVSVELSKHDTQKSEKLNLVKFNSVTFFYPTRPDVMVHRALSFSIPRGKCTVVVGASGSGKTTLAKLLLGMYPPNKGSIQYDGARIVSGAAHDMEDKEQVEEFILASGVRRRVSYLPQEAPLFHTTIANNLLYGLDDASERTSNLHTGEDMVDIPESMMEAMHHAAQRAAAHDFIMQLPLQYNTVVGGESGRTLLSGGQKQRLILARCFIRKPELMILDEPTNGLDAQCIEAFHKTVRQLCSEPNRIDEQLPGQISNPPVTVLLFTHRMQTAVQLAQHLIILADGSVTYEGPHGKQSEDLLESLLR